MLSYDDLAIVVLAAGRGRRMRSDNPKVLHQIMGKSMISRVVGCASQIVGKNNQNIYVVVGYQASKIQDELNNEGLNQLHFIFQEQLNGTGDAVKSVLIYGLSNQIKDVLVLCGDVPLIRKNTIHQLISKHRVQGASVTLLASELGDASGYGRILTDKKGKILAIREDADASVEERKVNIVNSGIYCFNLMFLQQAIYEIKPGNFQAEYYLTDIVEIANNTDCNIEMMVIEDAREFIGVNTKRELIKAEALFNELESELS